MVSQDGSDPDHALNSLPHFLKVDTSSIPGAGKGVFALQPIEKRTRFGPYEGQIEHLEDDVFKKGYAWQISKNGKKVHLVDAQDPAWSNWLRFVNCPCNEEQQNLVAFQYRSQIYYRTYKRVEPGQELLVWYGDAYAKDLGICMGSDDENPTVQGNENPTVQGNENPTVQGDLPPSDQPSGSGMTMHRCEFCPKAFLSRDMLSGHVKRHGDRTGTKRYKCPHCTYSTDRITDLNNHMRTHTGAKPHVCSHCSRAFTVRSNLRTHERTHTGQKPHVCSHCSKAFAQRSDLQRHERIHTGQKPHVCSHCSRAFAQRSALQRHERTHTGEKPYVCFHCQKRFIDLSSMNWHMIHNHTDAHPHRCSQCSKGFMRPSLLHRHMAKHHPNEE